MASVWRCTKLIQVSRKSKKRNTRNNFFTRKINKQALKCTTQTIEIKYFKYNANTYFSIELSLF